MNVLLDTNIVLDVLLGREPWLEDAREVWQACDDGRLAGWISPVTLTTIYYIGRKQLGSPKARQAVSLCLKAFHICPVHRQTIDMALGFNGKDFEDDMQCACACIAALNAIVSRDVSGFVSSPVPAMTPRELLRRLEAEES